MSLYGGDLVARRGRNNARLLGSSLPRCVFGCVCVCVVRFPPKTFPGVASQEGHTHKHTHTLTHPHTHTYTHTPTRRPPRCSSRRKLPKTLTKPSRRRTGRLSTPQIPSRYGQGGFDIKRASISLVITHARARIQLLLAAGTASKVHIHSPTPFPPSLHPTLPHLHPGGCTGTGTDIVYPRRRQR